MESGKAKKIISPVAKLVDNDKSQSETLSVIV